MQLTGTLPTLFAQPFSSIIKCIAKKPSAIDSDSLKPLSVLHSNLRFEWKPIFSIFSNLKKSNFSMRIQKYLKKISSFFCPQKVEKNHPQKLLRIPQIHFFPYCPNCPNGRIPVPKCGLLTNCT